MEIDAQAEFDALKAQYLAELEATLTNLHNLDLAFDREVMERILDLAPPGLDEIMALNRAMDLLAQGSYDLFILDSAPTGHLLRLLELPELVDQWLKVIFGIVLKYRDVLRLPKLSSHLVQLSKNLKMLRALLNDANRSAVYIVAILSEMAFQETRDLVFACRRMDVRVQVLFLNLATPYSDCPLCSALHKRESRVKQKFQESFVDIHRALVYRQGEPRGLARLLELGRVIYHNMHESPNDCGCVPGREE